MQPWEPHSLESDPIASYLAISVPLSLSLDSPNSQAPLAESWSSGPDPTLPTGLMGESRTKVSDLFLLPWAR